MIESYIDGIVNIFVDIVFFYDLWNLVYWIKWFYGMLIGYFEIELWRFEKEWKVIIYIRCLLGFIYYGIECYWV